MIAYGIYLILFAALIYRNAFFGLFKDDAISKPFYTLAFLIKASAVPVFYWIYNRYYGGIQNLDAGKFFHDATVFNQLAYDNPVEFLKALFGLQTETPGSYCYEHLLLKTQQWDNGEIRSFLFNDNRVLIRIHGVLHFISFNSYFVHALFCSFYSLIGIHILYKALKPYFLKREKWLVLCFVFFPSLYLFTGALLKEGLTFLCIGFILFSWKKFSEVLSWRWLLICSALLFIAIVLKPYILLPIWCFFGFYFLFPKRQSSLFFLLSFLTCFILGAIVLNLALTRFKGKSIAELFSSRQMQFSAVAQGGIFLANDSVFLRLENDTSLITKRNNGAENNILINKGAAFTYWKNNNNKDTLYCQSNTDTSTLYHEMFRIAPSRNNLPIPAINNSWKRFCLNSPYALYYVCFHPLFFNAKGVLELIVSFENLVFILTCVLLIFYFKKLPDRKLALTVIGTCLLLFVLIGYTSPNLGAIVRYRCLLMPVLISLPLGLSSLRKSRL